MRCNAPAMYRAWLQEHLNDGERLAIHPDHPKYAITSLGRVISFSGRTPRILIPSRHGDGYQLVSIEGRSKLVHRLVARAFLGTPPSKTSRYVLHFDGDPTNNTLENLRYGSAADNAADRDRLGRTARGERHGRARLSAERVRTMRRNHAEGESMWSLAKREGVSYTTARNAIAGRTWSHITDEEDDHE